MKDNSVKLKCFNGVCYENVGVIINHVIFYPNLTVLIKNLKKLCVLYLTRCIQGAICYLSQ